MPGFLPDETPMLFVGDDAEHDARAAIADEMERDADHNDETADVLAARGDHGDAPRYRSMAADLRAMADSVRNSKGEGTHIVGGRAYFVSRV
jgi:hypothetical protein